MKLRFVQNSHTETLPKGVERTYRICAEPTDDPLFLCNLTSKQMRGESSFLQDDVVIGKLQQTTKIGSPKWSLLDTNGSQIGHLQSKGMMKSGWQISTADGSEIEMFDATKVTEQILRTALGGWADGYACSKGGELVGKLAREPRGIAQPAKGLLGKLRKMITDHDWVYSGEKEITQHDLLPLCVIILATIEITVPATRST